MARKKLTATERQEKAIKALQGDEELISQRDYVLANLDKPTSQIVAGMKHLIATNRMECRHADSPSKLESYLRSTVAHWRRVNRLERQIELASSEASEPDTSKPKSFLESKVIVSFVPYRGE